MTTELRVPVERVEVELLLGDGRRRRGVVFLPPGSKVEELLERSAFLPIEEEGKVRLYAPGALACVAVFGAKANGAAADELPTEARALSVRLRSGETVEGELRYVPWQGRPRTADLLNEPGSTIALHAGREVVRHVAKAHVECVEEV